MVSVDALSMYSWPDDIGTIQEFVTIDFDVDVKLIASQTADDFHAIEPIGSCYPYKDHVEEIPADEFERQIAGEDGG